MMHVIISFLSQNGYELVFIWVLAGAMGLPIPSAPVFVAVGALAGIGQLSLVGCIALGVLAAVLGDFFWFGMGRRHGGRMLSLLCRISFEPDSCIVRTENIFNRYGARTLLIKKFVPGMSSVSTSMAGMISMAPSRFFFFSSMGSIAWVGAYTLLGYFLSKDLDRALAYTMGTGDTLLVFVLGGLMLYIARKYFLRRRFYQQTLRHRITPDELKQKLDAGESVAIYDVRHSLDFESDPYIIPGAVRMSLEQVEMHPDIFFGDQEIVLYCTCPNDASSARIAQRLQQKGITKTRPLAGGLPAWRKRRFPVEPANNKQ